MFFPTLKDKSMFYKINYPKLKIEIDEVIN